MRLHATRRAAIAQGRGLGNPLWDLAGVPASLDQRFAESKSLVDAVSGQNLITFTRASTGTFVDSDGVIRSAGNDVASFEHHPTTGECLGLLPEEQRQNLLVRSEEFDNASWVKINASASANATTAPDGLTTADKIVENTAANVVHIAANETASVVSGTAYTLSVFLKAAERSWVFVLGSGTPFGTNGFYVNLATGALGSVTGTPSNVTVQARANGWYRVSMTLTAGSSGSAGLQVRPATGDGGQSYTGDGASGLFLWGAQLEAGSFPTSYIPTTGTAATRTASLADVINQAIANNIRTLFLEFRSPASGTRGVVSLNDNTANERAAVITSGTDPRLVVHDGGVEQANINGGTVTANQRTRIAVRINANDFAISINGGTVVTDTSGTLPTVDRLMLGRTQAGEYLNAPLARVTGWTQLLPDSTLQELAR
jgi:hypothetical protein